MSKVLHMYTRRRKKVVQTELKFVEFSVPESSQLNARNRWVRLALLIPWDAFENQYALNFNGRGNEALPFRVALGTLIIQEQLCLTDREVVEEITENPYMQYFLGYEKFLADQPFDSSSLVHFRKRISADILQQMNERIAFGEPEQTSPKQDSSANEPDDKNEPPLSGKLIVDATCAPEDMKYPTDLGVLNDAREITEQVIDNLWEAGDPTVMNGIKPRTYRKKARNDFLSVIRKKKPKHSAIRKGIRKQINYLARNLKTISALVDKGVSLSVIDNVRYRKLLVAAEILRQQTELFNRTNRRDRHVSDRIVSVSKPHVRPIVRGKARVAVEFGAKISASVIDGMFLLDRHSWDSYNECGDLINQAEKFKARTGHFPASIHADQIYRTSANRAWCKVKGIRLSGPPLGRPPEDPDVQKEMRRIRKRDEIDRIEIEGKFGVGKRRFGLGLIMTKLRETSEHAVALVFVVMNLNKILRDLLLSILEMVVKMSFGKILSEKIRFQKA